MANLIPIANLYTMPYVAIWPFKPDIMAIAPNVMATVALRIDWEP